MPVVVSDVHTGHNGETAWLIHDAGGTAHAVAADVSRWEDVKQLIEATKETFGPLDVACNNAGIEGEQAVTTDCTEANWDRVVDIDLKGVWLCMKYEIPLMLEHGGGCIVNVASVAGLVGFPGIPAYVASKHGINGLTKTAALECAGKNIRVNAICPGAIETLMIERFTYGTTEQRTQLETMHPLGRMGTAGEVARGVRWLCSDEASFVTGHIMTVDGGFTAR